MNRVRDGVDQLAAEGRSDLRRVALRVAHLAAGGHTICKPFGLQTLKSELDRSTDVRCELRLALNSYLPVPMIVVDQALLHTSQQTGEVVETMSNVTSNGCVEDDWDFLRVYLLAESVEQGLGLEQDGLGGLENPAPILHVAPLRCCRRVGSVRRGY